MSQSNGPAKNEVKCSSDDVKGALNDDEDGDGANRCPNCGSSEKHRVENYDRFGWLGLGETDVCSICGAAYEHWDVSCRKPLNEQSLRVLIQTAREVEDAYCDVSRPMTVDQITKNRGYFKRLVDAMAKKDAYHINNRLEQCRAVERREKLIEEAADLFGVVHNGATARMFYKYLYPELSGEDLMEAIASLRRELEQLASCKYER